MAQLAALAVSAMSSIGPTLQAAGTILGAVGAISSGNAANEAAKYEAKVLETQGKNEEAIAGKQAAELRREKRLAQSRARAVGAAFGGGVDNDILGDIEEVGELNALTALWEGQEARIGRNAQAAASRYEGKQLKKAGYLKGLTTLVSGGGSLYDKYGADLFDKYEAT